MDEIKRLKKLAGIIKKDDDWDLEAGPEWNVKDDLYIIAYLEVELWDEENESSGVALFKYEGKIQEDDIEDMSQNYYPYKLGMSIKEWLKDIQFNVWNVDGYLESELESISIDDTDFDIDKAKWENGINGWIETVKII